MDSVNAARQAIIDYFEDSGMEPDGYGLDAAAEEYAAIVDSMGLDIEHLEYGLRELEERDYDEGKYVGQRVRDALTDVCIKYGL